MLKNKIYVCGIGAQKAGTTFLADYLQRHPNIMISPLKELHFFDGKFLASLCSGFEKKLQDDSLELLTKLIAGKKVDVERLIALIKRMEAGNKDQYRLFFRYFIKNQHVAFGDITPAYAMLDHVHYKKIAAMFPDHRFIFLLRNPADRFWSQLNYDLQNKNSTENPIELIKEKIKNESYMLRSNYKRTIEELSLVIDKENILVEFYENIFSDKSNETIKRISNFIGIDFREDLLVREKKVNKTSYRAKLDEENRLYIIRELKEVYKYILDRYDTPASWHTDYNKI